MIEPLIRVLITDNPNEALSIFRQNKERILELQAQAQAQAAQQAKMDAQLTAQKNAIPLQREEMITEREIELLRMKQADLEAGRDFKGTIADIKETNDRDKMLLQSNIRMDEDTHRAGLNRNEQNDNNNRQGD